MESCGVAACVSTIPVLRCQNLSSRIIPLLTCSCILDPAYHVTAMRSISHVAACRVELALCHRAPGMGFQEH